MYFPDDSSSATRQPHVWQATLELFWRDFGSLRKSSMNAAQRVRSLGRLPQFQTTIADFRRCDNRSALVDLEKAVVRRIISLQYNPDSLTRSLQTQGMSADGGGGDRLEVLRLKGPPVETIKLDAEIDATDQLEFPDQNSNATEPGIPPRLAARESIVYPSSDQLQSNNALAKSGTLEIIPMQSALTLFIWSKNRIIPVRLTDFSITGEAFDPSLNPIRAKVSLGVRVFSVNDGGKSVVITLNFYFTNDFWSEKNKFHGKGGPDSLTNIKFVRRTKKR